MKNKTRHLISLGILVIFALFAVSSRVNRLQNGAFNYKHQVEDASDNCLVKNDGTKVYGKKISWNTGILPRKIIKIDGQAFPRSEIKGYYENGSYFGLYLNEYGRRIIHGKVNVYVQFKMITTTSPNTNGPPITHTYTDAFHYAQTGEDGPMISLSSKKDIKKLLETCPLAVEIVDKASDRKIRRDPDYLNHAFDVYNAGCSEPEGKDSTTTR